MSTRTPASDSRRRPSTGHRTAPSTHHPANGPSTTEVSHLAAYALTQLTAAQLAEAIRAVCPWAGTLPPAARRMLNADVTAARRAGDTEVAAVLAAWQRRSEAFRR